MNLITKRELLRTIAERHAVATKLASEVDRRIYTALVRLGDDPPEQKVESLFREHHRDTSILLRVPRCHVCNADAPQVVHIKNIWVGTGGRATSNGVVDETGHVAIYVCGDCLIKALNLTEENC